ncbi:MAG: hypothetical protein A2Y62_06735 [Candidatus Fischerbacteria bacterium RBG_13_37_8]|uniref:O-antigen ligase-related domain-containing protein n=1 Tax=Candidatus Fischerbacteria bacterium RBG_13_37_8 TaxID=1817863 RepID=A0A1F5VM73_9BACT|nr:MAG: hypothetical protein A2Y62_06735 [Candidatus Fischerbacteria bacterium RBG_13_37_8]
MRKDLSSHLFQSNTIQMRLGNWTIAYKIIKNYPLWGVGIGNLHIFYPRYMTANDIETKYAHNFFLQFPAETGFAGFLLLLVILSLFLISIVNVYKNKPVSTLTWACITSFLIFLAYSAIDISLYFPSIGFFGILCASLYFFEYKKQTAQQLASPLLLTPLLKIILFSLTVIPLLYCIKIHYTQSTFERSIDELKRGNISKATLSLEHYLDYFPTDIAAASLLLNTSKYQSVLEDRIDTYHKTLLYCPFSPRIHYMTGSLNMNDRFYYNAFINFSISHQLYPAKYLYNQAYKDSLNMMREHQEYLKKSTNFDSAGVDPRVRPQKHKAVENPE